MRRLVVAALAVWVARWAALELAALAGHLLPPREPRPGDPQPGVTPAPAVSRSKES